MWPNVLDEDPNKQEQRTWHEANPVKTGFKHSGTIWFHLREPDRGVNQNGDGDGDYEVDYDYDGSDRLMPGEKRPEREDDSIAKRFVYDVIWPVRKAEMINR